MRCHSLRRNAAFGRAAILMLVVGISLMLLWRAAAAQTPATAVIGYGKTLRGEVTSPRGQEHHFTGCVGESINLTVTATGSPAERFAPRVEIVDAATEQSIASAVAAANRSSITLEKIELPASGTYVVVVSGRSRADCGAYALTLDLNVPEGAPHMDGALTLNLIYGNLVKGTVAEAGADHWNFRGCEGDRILVELSAAGFVPEIKLLSPIAELPIATAEVNTAEVNEVGKLATATLTRTLPANGEYNLIVSGASDADAGSYGLTFTVAARATPTADRPTVTATTQPEATPTPSATSTDGPRGRRGIPTRQPDKAPVATATRRGSTPTVTPFATPTRTPTPTPTLTATPAAPPAATASATPFLPSDQLQTFCTVTTDRLNLRPGPGTNFNPPITVLETGALLVAIGRNADSSWLQVAVLDDNLVVAYTGWVSADFVFCVGNLDAAPVVEVAT